ncbi:MAG: glycosyltransferase [Sphingomonadaceae bacterium]
MENHIKTINTKTAPAPRWHGALEGLHHGLLIGWAIDTEHPDARVVLEICLDDDIVSCVAADVARSDLAAQFQTLASPPQDDCHGFVADLGPEGDRLAGRLTVRVANTGLRLTGQQDQQALPKPSVTASSRVFSDGALRLHGWAFDPSEESRTLEVRAYLDHQLVAQTAANLVHPALRAYEVGNHGFTLDMPPALADGQVHSVRVVDQNGNALNGSPLSVCCHLSGVKALLPRPAASDPAADLLANLIDVYERHVPRSLALTHYPAWAAHFEAAQAAPPLSTALAALRIGILVDGDPAPEARQRTLASLQAQGLPMRVYGEGTLAARLRLAMADSCDVLACVRAGDTLTPQALPHLLTGLLLPQAQLVYSDSEQNGQPWFKPAWNPDYALASDYPLHGMLFRTSVLPDLLARTEPQDPAQLAWQVLAALWPQGMDAIIHLPRVLYQVHSPLSEAEQAARDLAARQALQQVEPAAVLTPLPHAPRNPAQACRRVLRPLSADERNIPVSLIIPTRDHVKLLERCISTLQAFTDWPQLELIVIDNGSTDAATLRYLRRIAKQGVKVLTLPGPFNFADLNNQAVAAASGEIVGLINNDIEALHAGWLDELIGQLLRPGVGAVGAKLLWPNGMVQHGGVLLGVGNVAGHYGNRLADADWGDHGRNQLQQQVSGVTAACLLLRKADYQALGGMDGRAFPVAFNDVDLCLKVRRSGKSIIWTPHARLLHAESASRGHEDTPQKRARAQREVDLLRQRWGAVLLRDPAYHPSLNLDPHSHAFGGLALPPRARTARHGHLDASPT